MRSHTLQSDWLATHSPSNGGFGVLNITMNHCAHQHWLVGAEAGHDTTFSPNRVLPRECIGHSKHPLSTTKEKSSESGLPIGWPKYWSFSFSISPSNTYSVLISSVDCLDLLAVQGTLKSLLQYHSSKASILWHSAFFRAATKHLCVWPGAP